MRCFTRGVVMIALSGSALVACGSDGGGPPAVNVVGSYHATFFAITPSGGSQVDVLSNGGSLTIALASDLTTTGTLVVPAALNGGTAVNASMAGTWANNSGVVMFSQTAVTFVRQLAWSVQGGTLVASGNINGSVTSVVLSR